MKRICKKNSIELFFDLFCVSLNDKLQSHVVLEGGADIFEVLRGGVVFMLCQFECITPRKCVFYTLPNIKMFS